MSKTVANQRSWTLRLKCNRSTILLHVEPTQKWSSIREELLKAIHETHPEGELHGTAIPQNPDDVILARPINPLDLSEGWQELELPEDADGTDGGGKGKGKAALINNTKSSKMSLTNSPIGAGLKDGSFVAFRFRSTKSTADDQERLDREGDDALLVDLLEEWDVVIASMDDPDVEEEEEIPIDFKPRNALSG